MILLWQWVALSFYALCMGVCFCDGFKMPNHRKLIWFGVFLITSFLTLQTTGEYKLEIILPITSLVAIALGRYEVGVRNANHRHKN